MKFKLRPHWRDVYLTEWDGTDKVYTVKDLVDEACTPDPYGASGAVESLEERVSNLTSLVARMLENTCSVEDITGILEPSLRYKIVPIEDGE